MFNQTVADRKTKKDFAETLSNLLHDKFAAICNVIISRPSGLVSRRSPDWENQISILADKNNRLVAFAFKTM